MTDVSTTLLSVFLGGLLTVWFPSFSGLVGIVAVAVITISALTALYRRWREYEPLFTHLKVEKTLRFLDREARLATLLTKTTSRANRSGITQMWFRNLSADGSIENVLLDGLTPDEVLKKAGSLQICKNFSKPMKAGDTVNVELSYNLRNSFSGAVEGMTHVTSTKTYILRMTAIFVPDRKPRTVRAFVEFGGSAEKTLPIPRSSQDSTVFTVEIDKPKLGAFYTLEWEW